MNLTFVVQLLHEDLDKNYQLLIYEARDAFPTVADGMKDEVKICFPQKIWTKIPSF